MSSLDVLHVSFGYGPDLMGGTEIYVHSLVKELSLLGVRCAVAAPGPRETHYQFEDVTVFRIAAELSTAHLYGVESTLASQRWQSLLQRLQPKILHVHARTPMLHSAVLAQAKAMGMKVIFTAHTPTAFCQRGTMLEFGEQPCDGRVALHRCSACTLHGLGLHKTVAHALTALPASVATFGANIAPHKIAKALRFKESMRTALLEQKQFFQQCDQIVAVCEWIHQALLLNGVDSKRMCLNRQGLRTDMPAAAAAQEEIVAARTGALRVLALGRADPTKGFDRLVQAITSCQGAATLDLALSGSAANPGWMQKLHELIGGNPQIRLHFDLSGARLLALFGNADLVAVPSTWMETGPLVVLEAFSQQVPVLGSRRGGIAELVKDGVDGWLVETESLADWTQMLMRLAQDRALLTKARSNIGRVRTMARVAEEHRVLYQKLLANDTAHSQGELL